ncbi:MAG: hypothetical protein CMJ18_23405 [Phycisphaeraceae bacterium]|nr:hypothetical protein [Phycisphaeraceae bacterium]
MRRWEQWRQSARDPEVARAIRDQYAAVDEAVSRRGPTCWISGRCCRFDEFDHRLYVTGLEIAWVLEQVVSAADGRGLRGAGSAPGCPFQIDGLCSIHDARPLGCRVFFCQQGTEDWQRELYEEHQAAIRRIHDRFGVDYEYMEWRAGLAASNGTSPRP